MFVVCVSATSECQGFDVRLKFHILSRKFNVSVVVSLWLQELKNFIVRFKFLFFFFFFKCFWDSGVPLFHQSNSLLQSFQTLLLLLLLQRITCYNQFFHSLFCLLSVFSRLMPCWPGLLLEATHYKRLVPSYGIFSFRLSVLVPSRPMPYHPGLFAKPSPACVLVPPFGIFSSKLLTFRKIR